MISFKAEKIGNLHTLRKLAYSNFSVISAILKNTI